MLEQAIKKYAEDAVPVTAEKPIALILPHAGYIYSGQICADGYRQAMGQKYDTVVILGTNHTTPDFNKISVYARGAFKTPLGEAKIDETVASALLARGARARAFSRSAGSLYSGFLPDCLDRSCNNRRF
jgi:hypothetical protein